MISITTGPLARGDDFFNREKELARIWEIISKGSVLLAAPRRVGKTSLMIRLLDKIQSGFHGVYIEAEAFRRPDDLAEVLIIKAGELRKDPKYLIKKFLSETCKNFEELELWKLRLKLRERTASDWKHDADVAIRDMLRPDSRLILILDELPLMLHNMISDDKVEGRHNVVDLLKWLRHIRFEPDISDKISMVIGGSIGIERIVSHLNASMTINDVTRVEVGPFDTPSAREFAKELFDSKRIPLDELTMNAFIETVDTPIPIFVQILVSAVANESINSGKPVTPALIKQAYHERALGPEYKHFFEDYYERITRYYTPDESRAAKRMLTSLAFETSGLKRTTLFDIYKIELGNKVEGEDFDLLVTALQNDFYIKVSGNGDKIEFENKWLKDWWRRYHGLGT